MKCRAEYAVPVSDPYRATEACVQVLTPELLEQKEAFEANVANIYDPAEPFATGTWYWRVDAVVDGDVVRGPVWQFTVD